MKGIKRATLVVAILSFIYIASSFLLLGTAYSLRMWVDVLGKVLLIMVLPLLLLIWGGRAFCRVVKGKKWIKVLLGLVVTGAYGFWVFWTFLFMVFTLQEERWLTKSLLVVNHGVGLGEASYQCYRPVAFVLRTPCEFDMEQKAKYLKEKYGRAFVVNGAEEVYDAEYPQLTIEVEWLGNQVVDDYIPLLWQKYLKEAYVELGLDREYFVSMDVDGSCSWTYLELKNEEDIAAFAEDASKLMQHVMNETDFFADYPVYLQFYQGEGEDEITGTLPFGNISKWHELEEDYYKSPKLVAERINSEYAKAVERLIEEKRFDEEWREQQEAISEGESLVTDASEDDVLRKENAAKLIYDKVLKEQGYSYMVKYNAKGDLYLDLGNGYTLVYDRTSKNGTCELFVLYQEDMVNGEEMHILEMYAAEPEAEQVIASGRRTWSDVGSEEYREATGE